MKISIVISFVEEKIIRLTREVMLKFEKGVKKGRRKVEQR
jgi:hypothetical protein